MPFKRTKPNHHQRKKRQAPHKFLEMALIADDFAISAYGEKEMTYHLLTIAHIVSVMFNSLTPRSDQYINSVFHFNTLSSRQVMRIRKIIN